MIEQVSNAIQFLAHFVASGVGATGLTVTVDVRKWDGTTVTTIATDAATTEIGGGLYGYSLASGSTSAEAVYTAVFKTAGTADQKHLPALWCVGKAGVENLNATVSSRHESGAAVASVTGDVAGKVLGGGSGTISGVGARVVDGDGDAVAKASAVAALGSGTGPNQVNVTVSSSAGGTLQGVSVRMKATGLGDHTAVTNASGVAPFNLAAGSWSLTAALNGYSYSGSTQVVSTNPQAIAITMTVTTVSVPSGPNKSIGVLLCLDSGGDPESGVTVSFQMVAGPGDDGYSLDAEIVEEECDSEGVIEREFLRGATYDAWRGVRGARARFTVPDAASFNLPEHLGVD